MSEIAKECYTLNLSEEEMRKLKMPDDSIAQYGLFSKKKSNIKHLTGNSLEFDFAKLDKKFDLVFIDGNHHFEYIKNDSEKVFRYILHENSTVVWHDYKDENGFVFHNFLNPFLFYRISLHYHKKTSDQ